MEDRQRPETYFSGLAAEYERNRPRYPLEAALRVVGRPAGSSPRVRVADVGAGTGIFSRALVEAGAEVVAVEPNEAMRERGRRETVGLPVSWCDGSGETTGLPDASVDAAACAQSFHWMDAERASRELARIVRPGGRIALVWNVRDDRDAFTARYGETVERAQGAALDDGRVVSRVRSLGQLPPGLLTPVERHAVGHRQRLDLEELLGRARSCSYWPQPGALREELEGELREAFDDHAEDGRVALAYQCEVALVSAAQSGSR